MDLSTIFNRSTAFSDFSLSVEDVIAEGEKVMTRYTWRGTQQGPLLGIAPTGKQATVTGIVVSRVVEGKIVEEWGSSTCLVCCASVIMKAEIAPPWRYLWGRCGRGEGFP